MNRRGFLTGILALGAAPAIVRADSLMRVVARNTTVITANFGELPFVYGPAWLRATMQKSGGGYWFRSYSSMDGVNWMPHYMTQDQLSMIEKAARPGMIAFPEQPQRDIRLFLGGQG